MNSDKISIFGLGYVGGTAAYCFKRLGFEIYGVDIDPQKCGRCIRGPHNRIYENAITKEDMSYEFG